MTIQPAGKSGRHAFKRSQAVDRAPLVLGSRQAATRWLSQPAMGLDQQKRIDLLATPAGTQLVEEFLDRLEYGIYVYGRPKMQGDP